MDLVSRDLSSQYGVFGVAGHQGHDIMLMVKKYMTFRRIMSSSSGSSSPLLLLFDPEIEGNVILQITEDYSPTITAPHI